LLKFCCRVPIPCVILLFDKIFPRKQSLKPKGFEVVMLDDEDDDLLVLHSKTSAPTEAAVPPALILHDSDSDDIMVVDVVGASTIASGIPFWT
jgi:hypothetical protein